MNGKMDFNHSHEDYLTMKKQYEEYEKQHDDKKEINKLIEKDSKLQELVDRFALEIY
jgi:hypothetical protein